MASWTINRLLQTQTALETVQNQQLRIRALASRGLAFLLLGQVLRHRTCFRPRIDYGNVNVALLQLAGW